MAKRSSKSEDLIESLCDDRVINALTSKMAQSFNEVIDSKLNELKLDITNAVQETLDNLITSKIKEISSPLYDKINILEQRVNQLESINYQKDLLIFGYKPPTNDSNDEGNVTPSTNSIIPSILDLLKSDLNLHYSSKDINYAFYMKKKEVNKSYSSPILVSFSTTGIKQEILQRVRLVRKQSLKSNTYSRIYYNERLTKSNQEILFQARSLLKDRKIISTWTFKGDVYIKKELTSLPMKIISLNQLTVPLIN